jgi:multidrug transporter EmrE-like cation transporter
MIGESPGALLQQASNIVAARPSFRFSRAQSIALVFGCTILGAGAQILIKTGANALTGGGVIAMLMSPHLLAGYCLYGLSTALLVLALRDGELSILYPVISLTFVWVTILSTMVFNEAITVFKVMGVSVIVAGVAVLGKDGRKT